jgi:hypothetical protein
MEGYPRRCLPWSGMSAICGPQRFGSDQMNGLPWNNNSWEVAAQIAARWARNVAAWHTAAGSMALTNTAETPLPPARRPVPNCYCKR